jgi:hypothetical protein
MGHWEGYIRHGVVKMCNWCYLESSERFKIWRVVLEYKEL